MPEEVLQKNVHKRNRIVRGKLRLQKNLVHCPGIFFYGQFLTILLQAFYTDNGRGFFLWLQFPSISFMDGFFAILLQAFLYDKISSIS